MFALSVYANFGGGLAAPGEPSLSPAGDLPTHHLEAVQSKSEHACHPR